MYYRRERGDMIQVFKILTKRDRVDSDTILPRNESARTRGHSMKLSKRQCRLNIRKHSFGLRVTNKWNSLPESVISAKSVNDFKDKLDKHWSHRRYCLRPHACADSNISVTRRSEERVLQA